MKQLFLFFAFLPFFLVSCDEVPPNVTGVMDVAPPPTTGDLADQKRQILVEEFTGVRCVNCPAGSAAIENLLGQHGEQLVAVSIHAGEFSPPYSQSLYDFRTSEGTEIINFVGIPFGFPTAVVNRKKFEGEFGLQLGQQKWAGYIGEELLTEPKIKIGMTPNFNIDDRKLNVEITLLVAETITEPNVHLSLMVSESGVIDYQLVPGGNDPIPDYSHNHVLRGMITNFDGDPLTENLIAGAQFTKEYTFDFPAEWDESHCHVIAFVNVIGADSKEVLQAQQVDVME